MTKFARSFVFVFAALSFVLAACGAPATATESPAAEPTEAATEAPVAEPTEAPTEDPMAMYAPATSCALAAARRSYCVGSRVPCNPASTPGGRAG